MEPGNLFSYRGCLQQRRGVERGHWLQRLPSKSMVWREARHYVRQDYGTYLGKGQEPKVEKVVREQIRVQGT